MKGTLPNLDQAPKGQMRPVMNEPVDKPKSLGKLFLYIWGLM